MGGRMVDDRVGVGGVGGVLVLVLVQWSGGGGGNQSNILQHLTVFLFQYRNEIKLGRASAQV